MGRVGESIRLGADAVSVHVNIGAKEEPDMLHDLGLVSDECTEWNVPLVAMMCPKGRISRIHTMSRSRQEVVERPERHRQSSLHW